MKTKLESTRIKITVMLLAIVLSVGMAYGEKGGPTITKTFKMGEITNNAHFGWFECYFSLI